MVDIFPKLFEILPDAEDLLSLEPEELAGPLLVSLHGSDYINPLEAISYELLENGGIQEYMSKGANKILFALMEAWQWLEREGFVAPRPNSLANESSGGLVTHYFVTRRGKRIGTSDTLTAYRRANLLPKRQLHTIIAQKVWSLFLRGDYDCAVFQAFKEVEIAVRNAGNYDEQDFGVHLMRKAFHVTTGKLTNTNLPNSEQEAMLSLFAGAIGMYRNPFSHRDISVTAEEAAEMIIFASHLLRVVDSREQI